MSALLFRASRKTVPPRLRLKGHHILIRVAVEGRSRPGLLIAGSPVVGLEPVDERIQIKTGRLVVYAGDNEELSLLFEKIEAVGHIQVISPTKLDSVIPLIVEILELRLPLRADGFLRRSHNEAYSARTNSP